MVKKGPKSKKYFELYEKLWDKFKTARAKRHRVNFQWLWKRAHVLYREINASDESVIKPHVTVRFLRKYNIGMRRRQ